MRSTARPAVAGALTGLAVVALAATALSWPRTSPGSAPTSTPPAASSEHHTSGTTLASERPHDAAKHSQADSSASRSPARRLITATRRASKRWRSVAAAEADGFRSIGDGITGFEHYVRWDWIDDGAVLSPTRPESLVYRVGRRSRLVSAMYILEPGTTMRDVPDLGDRRAVWHRHTDLCWRGQRVVGLFIAGQCMPQGRLRVTPPMLHVWVRPHPCGPFAGLELRQETCTETPHRSDHSAVDGLRVGE